MRRVFFLIGVLTVWACGSAFASSPQVGDTLFVAIWGNDTGTGTRLWPYRTIQFALNNSATGYVIFVFPGVYNEKINFTNLAVELRSEKGPDSTTIDGSGKGTPVVLFQSGEQKSAAATLQSVPVIDGFTITCPSCQEELSGGITVMNMSPIIRNNRIIDNDINTVNGWGAGIAIDGYCSPLIYNNVIARNKAYHSAGINVGYGARPYVYNNTIVGNDNTYAEVWDGAGIHIGWNGGGTFRNNIIAYNSDGYGMYKTSDTAIAVLSHTLFYQNEAGDYIGNFTIGAGVISDNIPGFVNYTEGDYHLTCGSVAINAGDSATIAPLTSTDMEGNLRIAYGDPDLGALEVVDSSKQANFTAAVTSGCPPPLTVNFTNTSTCVDEQWLWDFGDGDSSAAKNPMHEYTQRGKYSVTLRAWGEYDPLGDTRTRTDYIWVYDTPEFDFAADTAIGCVPLTVAFTATSEDSIDVYQWTFGDGAPSSYEPSPTHEYITPGRYTVRLFAQNDCGSNNVVKEGYIRAEQKPVVEIASSYDDLGGELPCAPYEVQFYTVCEESLAAFEWDFGDDSPSTERTPVHVYESGGTYTVELIVTGLCDTSRTVREQYITVLDRPAVTLQADPAMGCVPFSVTFAAISEDSIFSYLWDFGDGSTSEESAPIHEYTAADRCTVTLIATGPCGVDTTVEYILAERKAEVTIVSSYDDLGGEIPCAPYEVQFYTVCEESLVAFEWGFGDDSTSTEQNPVHVYDSGGTYTVELTVTGLCDTSRAVREQYITVRDRPTATLRADTVDGCVPLTVQFDVDISGLIDSLMWYFGDGDSSSAVSVAHTYASPDRYRVTLVIIHECDTDVIYLADTIVARDRPTAYFGCPSDYGIIGYAPFSREFYDYSTNQPSEWSWEFGDGGTSDERHPRHIFAEPGIYTVSLTASNSCGTSTPFSKPGCVIVGGYDLTVGEPSQAGDTTVYPVDVDTVLFSDYPNQVYLSADVQPTPNRGSLSAVFTSPGGAPNPSGVPPFTRELRLKPSGDLPSGTYTIDIFAVDSTLGYVDSATVSLEHEGQIILALDPDTLDFDSVQIGTAVDLPVRIINAAMLGSQFWLTIDSAFIEGEAFSADPVRDVTLLPGFAYSFTVSFSPDEPVEYAGAIRIMTNDPVVRDTSIFLVGRGMFEQEQPVVVFTRPDSGASGVLISDTNIIIGFSEPIIIWPSDPALIAESWRTGEELLGQLQSGGDTVVFTLFGYLLPFDSIFVQLVADQITDTAYNRLDGNLNGLEEGSPIDDYHFFFVTGPGVYPGDTDDNREVDERDVLPIGRFWGTKWRERPLKHESFTIQPAYLWPDSAATYADADGDGTVDSLDVCPVLEFWSATANGQLARAQDFWEDVAALDMAVLRSIYNAIDYCPDHEAAGTLKGILSSWIEQKDESVLFHFELFPNYPNPFNTRTVITYTLPAAADVELAIFNTKGEKVAVLAIGYKSEGRHAVVWDGHTSDGKTAASGMYFYRLKAGDFRQARKMTLLK